MSARLRKAIATGKIVIKNRCASQVSIVVKPPAADSDKKNLTFIILIPGNAEEYRLSERITMEQITRSNLADLIARRLLEIV